ncbi:homeobox-leucine zipper protein HOX11-like [Cornus florida]|uniref:homeobox-leucine zipper protein HOX11-like n=1 Tax=Cornus florida TaxID=4283 RepID=UPI002897F5B5|nr:homeobox-leucine zipper protein HOX11-like [Cornus florida]
MELALSLGDTPKPFTFLDNTQKIGNKELGFCMGLGSASLNINEGSSSRKEELMRRVSTDPPVQLGLLPFSTTVQARKQPSSQLCFPWLTDKLISEPGSSDGPGRRLDVNRLPLAVLDDAEDGAARSSSPNSAVSSFRMDFSIYRSGRSGKRDLEDEVETERVGSSRASDEEENGLTRKKLRLSKDQSAFLEESFKEHNTLNPKQKLALAKQLNLRPRQVEVWFQNRRARTKLKQTEVDCEYLKRCCETLTEENRRLQKELHELRALKTSQPFYMQLPATTLTMCPSCERVASTSASAAATNNNAAAAAAATAAAGNTTSSPAKTRLLPFSQAQNHAHHAAS